MSLVSLVRELFPINCFYNFKEGDDGKCRSTECMLNQDEVLKDRIAREGCEVFKRHEGVIELRRKNG